MASTVQCIQLDAVTCLELVEPPVRQTEFGIRDAKLSRMERASSIKRSSVRMALPSLLFYSARKADSNTGNPNTAIHFTALRDSECIFWRIDDTMRRRAR
ncbi:uncharacterized protein PHALS_11002 [Plasmopara halstedii]|uniref:Uncharacterized protein n=1 Tax=Plasmopara halstedii TaxID=4781 RepID=A0A0P1AI38_PLAHL|nr:uncharacterized protein PHALS_11002 [Plasmopara halstedii]CEG40822.1 hypothetical protein PHALS_11002 [Plasmopara halstedii]|eukprot:XP_024577191.1 hypothetical protein PHALS_11002 [Plasmopara halstedii]